MPCVRKRPQISITIREDLLQKLDELAESMDCSRGMGLDYLLESAFDIADGIEREMERIGIVNSMSKIVEKTYCRVAKKQAKKKK